MQKKKKKDVKPWRQGILSHHQRGGLTQKQLGDISPQVRKEVRERSKGICELQYKCTGAPAVEQAHLIGRRLIPVKTTAEWLRDACVACHDYFDEDPEGIKEKRKIREALLNEVNS